LTPSDLGLDALNQLSVLLLGRLAFLEI